MPKKLTLPGDVVLHAAPTTVAIVLWLLLETSRRRAAVPRNGRWAGNAIAVGATAALGVLAWRTFDLLACDDLAAEWRYPTLLATSLLPVILLAAVAPRAPRLAILLFLAAAGASVFADWALSGGLLRTEAAATLVAVQQLWALLAVVAMAHLPARGMIRPSSTGGSTPRARARTSSVEAVDCLAKRRCDPDPVAEPERAWSWFW